MKHYTTSAFWKLHDALPEHIRKLAKRNYEYLKADPNHRSIQFKKLSGHSKHEYASARVGDHYRAVCILTEGDALWFYYESPPIPTLPPQRREGLKSFNVRGESGLS